MAVVRRLQGGLTAAVLAVASLASPAHALEIALTNDDGWDAGGIQALKTALRAAGHHVTLAAPLANQSGGSASIDRGNLCARKQDEDEYSVSLVGPTGCDDPAPTSARAAMSGLVAIGLVRERSEPDLLVSGINAGANTGAFTEISGTVGAAVLATSPAFEGPVPAIAISTDLPPACGSDAACARAHYEVVARFLVRLIEHLEKHPGLLSREPRLLPPGVALNVNFPATDRPRGLKVAAQGRSARIDGSAVMLTTRCGESCTSLPTGAQGLVIREYRPAVAQDRKDSDAIYLDQGYVTIVPITPDYTAGKASRYGSVVRGLVP